MKIEADLHVHTILSSCCSDHQQTVENVVPFLMDRGIRKIAFTDHMWNNPSVAPSGWYAPQNGRSILERKTRLKDMLFPIPVLFGAEADMCAPDKIGITKDFREKLDVVLLATDHFHMRGFMEDLPGPEEIAKIGPYMMKFFRAGLNSGLADILVHPLAPCGGWRKNLAQIIESVSDSEMNEALCMAAEKKIGMELNAAVITALEKDGGPHYSAYLELMKKAKKAKCLFTIGSDSHSLDDFKTLEAAERFADAMELTAADMHPLMHV